MIMRRQETIVRSFLRKAIKGKSALAVFPASILLGLVVASSPQCACAEKLGADQPVGAGNPATSEVANSEIGTAAYSGSSFPSSSLSALPSSARLLSAGIVAAGMTFQQVLKAVGPAPEKVEFESSRRNIWHYSDGQVLFREGRVVKIDLPIVDAGSAALPELVSAPIKASEPKISKESERVLLEILKEIPSGPEGSSLDSNTHVPSPGSPLTPQALRVNPGMAPFGGISNAEALEDMAE